MSLRFGTVSQVDNSKGLVRVNFEEDNIVSYWLSVAVPSTKDDSFCSMPDIGEHVYCVMDENSENGVVGGAVFSADHLPALATRGIQFKDGMVIKYDRVEHKLTATISSTSFELSDESITVKVSDTEHTFNASGHIIQSSTESLKQILSDILDAINAITHTETGTITGIPNNAAAFTAIKARLSNLFES